MAADEQAKPANQRNFGQTAALASLVAVIACWVIHLAYGGPPKSATLEQGKFYAEIVQIILRIGGILCAMVALVSIRRFGAKGILAAALLGLLWNSGYFILGGPKRLSVLRAYGRAVAKDGISAGQAAANVAAASTKGVIAYGTIDFNRLDQQRDSAITAADSASGEDALVLRAWTETLGQIIAPRTKATEAEQKLIAAKVLDPASIKSTEDFVRRRWIANDWASAVHQSAVQLQTLPTTYERQLIQRGVSKKRSALEADCITANLPRASLESAFALHAAEQAVATRFNLAISALEDEWNNARDRAAFQPRPDSAAWKQNLEALAAAQSTLKRQREQVGFLDPWP